jgi:hypothetical protein
MLSIAEVLKGLSPDAQLVLMMCLFALILRVGFSRSATRNFRELIDAFVRLLPDKRKPSKELPTKTGQES